MFSWLETILDKVTVIAIC